MLINKKSKFLPSLILFFRPSVPIFSQNDSSFSSLRRNPGERGDLGLTVEAIVIRQYITIDTQQCLNSILGYVYGLINGF